MSRIILVLTLLSLLNSCQPEAEISNKNKFGAFVCTITAEEKGKSTCKQDKFKQPIPTSLGRLNTSSPKGNYSPLNDTVFLVDKSSNCEEIEDFFPVALVKIQSENSIDFIVIGMSCDPKYNPKEITDFFHFQLAHSRTMKSITEWIELEYEQKWIVTGWEDDKKAKAYLDRLGIKF